MNLKITKSIKSNLWKVIFLIVAAVSIAYLVKLYPFKQESNKFAASPVIEEINKTPAQIVSQFWELSLKGDFNNASNLIRGTSVANLYWKPEKSVIQTKFEYEPAKIKGSGRGSSNTNLIDDRYANSLKKNWTALLFKNQLRINKILSERINNEMAEVKLSLEADNFVSTYNVRVLLHKTYETDWKIIAIWD